MLISDAKEINPIKSTFKGYKFVTAYDALK